MLDPHHQQPKSQGGEETVTACRDCHSLYHEICGQRLASTVNARVQNFIMWMSKFPGASLMGPREGIRPGDMAPGFVHEEAGHFRLTGAYVDFSKGCLSRIEPVKVYPVRSHWEVENGCGPKRLA